MVIFHDVEYNQDLPFPLDLNQQIREIYELFDENEVKEPETYYLAYNGRVLHKSWTVKDAEIPNGAKIEIYNRQFINVIFQCSNINSDGSNQTHATISTDAFIGDIKEQLSKQLEQGFYFT